MEEAIRKDLDGKEASLKAKANTQWNDSDFVSLRNSNVDLARPVVERYIKSYENVSVRYPGSEDSSKSLLQRRVKIAEVEEAKRWLEENRFHRLLGEGYAAVLIPSGRFTMGCTSEQGDDCWYSEKPSHEVVLSRSYYMMETEVIQGLYKRITGESPSYFGSCGNDCPVENVSWYDAVRFANKLSVKEGLEKCYEIDGFDVKWKDEDCSGWRLPTETEWEYAAEEERVISMQEAMIW